jgi:hypothetical protein
MSELECARLLAQSNFHKRLLVEERACKSPCLV